MHPACRLLSNDFSLWIPRLMPPAMIKMALPATQPRSSKDRSRAHWDGLAATGEASILGWKLRVYIKLYEFKYLLSCSKRWIYNNLLHNNEYFNYSFALTLAPC